MPRMTNLELAYLAGFFDAEGSVSIRISDEEFAFREWCKSQLSYLNHAGNKPALFGRAHFYGLNDGYAGRIMANGERMNPQALTIAVRVDLLDTFRLGDAVRLTSACGVVTATVTDAMPMMPAFAQGVIVDVSPAVAAGLFCEGYGFSGQGIAYGEELVLVERLRAK